MVFVSAALCAAVWLAQSLRLVVLIVLCLAVPALASAATVKVRVEGKTRTLFGPTDEWNTPKLGFWQPDHRWGE